MCISFHLCSIYMSRHLNSFDLYKSYGRGFLLSLMLSKVLREKYEMVEEDVGSSDDRTKP